MCSVRTEYVEMETNEISKLAVDCAYRVHRELGPGLLESVYETVLADALRQKELGSVVAYGDVKGLKEEIVRALSSPAKGVEYRRNYVLQNYGWDKIADGWEEVYRQCAGE